MQATKRKKAVFITPYVWTSGRNKGMPTVFETFQGFIDHGYETHVIIATNQPHRDRVSRGIHYHYVQISALVENSKFDEEVALFGAIRSRFALLRHIKFRIVWLWFVIAASIKAIKLTRKLEQVQVIYAMTHFGTIPGYVTSRFTEEAVFVQRLFGSHAFLNWQREDGGIPWWALLVRFDELLALRMPSDLLILGNDGTAADKQAVRLGARPDRIRHWLNGIDRSKFTAQDVTQKEARSQLNLPPNQKRIISLGRLDEWKRVERLLQAMPLVKEHIPNLSIDVVGGGSQLARLQALAVELNIQDTVLFHGFIPHEQVVLFLAASDVYVSVQDYTNLGNNTIEALASGKPVVVYDVGTITEVVRDGIEGIVLNDTDPDQVASALVRLLSDDRLRRQLGAAAAKRSHAVFKSWSERLALEVREIERVHQDKFGLGEGRIQTQAIGEN